MADQQVDRVGIIDVGAGVHGIAAAIAGTAAVLGEATAARGAGAADGWIMTGRKQRPGCREGDVDDRNLQGQVRPVRNLALHRPGAEWRVEAQAEHIDILGILEKDFLGIEAVGFGIGAVGVGPHSGEQWQECGDIGTDIGDHARVRDDRGQRIHCELLPGAGDRKPRDVVADAEKFAGVRSIDTFGIAGGPRTAGVGGDEAHVGQARVVAHVVEAELGTVVEVLGVVLEGESVLSGVFRRLVRGPLEIGGGRCDQRKRIVQKIPDLVRIVRRATEAEVEVVAHVVGAGVDRREIGPRRRDLQRLPFILVDQFERGIVERIEAQAEHADRFEHFLDRHADTVEIVGVRRIPLVDAVDRDQRAFAPVDRLAADLERDRIVLDQVDRAGDVEVQQLQVGAGLLERASAAVDFGRFAGSVDPFEIAVGDGVSGDSGAVRVLGGDQSREVVTLIHVDRVIEIQPASEQREIAVAEREIL